MAIRYSSSSKPGDRLSYTGPAHSSSKSIPKVCTSADGNFNYVDGKEPKLSMVINGQSLTFSHGLLRAEIAEKNRLESDPQADAVGKLRAKYRVSIMVSLLDSHNNGTIDIADVKQKNLFKPDGVPFPNADSTTFKEALNEVVAKLKIVI
jgi:hypothetical protein